LGIAPTPLAVAQYPCWFVGLQRAGDIFTYTHYPAKERANRIDTTRLLLIEVRAVLAHKHMKFLKFPMVGFTPLFDVRYFR